MTRHITTPPQSPSWAKSSHSSPDGGNCLEWSPSTTETPGTIPVRDSKNPRGPVLTFTPSAFAEFIAGVKADAYSGPRQ
ncbi:DUF397 domain-containing protein [Streptomyces sp. NPDC052496]|uniref:DUF397 domain-containing protein n=1 Tax=Streptomyces sp. NPDC052496 TaxID=3154951 RepID=UPI003417DA7B